MKKGILLILLFLFIVGFISQCMSEKEKNNINDTIDVDKKVVEITESSKEKFETIVLEYGKIGNYGIEVEKDGEKIIEYHVPVGKYIIDDGGSKIKHVWLVSNSTHINEYGENENDVVNDIDLSASSQIVEVNKGYHFELIMNTKIILKKSD